MAYTTNKRREAYDVLGLRSKTPYNLAPGASIQLDPGLADDLGVEAESAGRRLWDTLGIPASISDGLSRLGACLGVLAQNQVIDSMVRWLSIPTAYD